MNTKPVLLTEETVEDFFSFLETDPRQGTLSYVYYVAPLKVNKKYVDEDGVKKDNPMSGMIYKVTKFQFNFGETYAKRVQKLNPDYEFKGRKGVFGKPEGYKNVEIGKNGLYLPIIPKKTESKYILKTGKGVKEVNLSDYQKYLPPPSSGERVVPSEFRNLLVDRVYRISAGGHVWKNPNFEFKELGTENLLEIQG